MSLSASSDPSSLIQIDRLPQLVPSRVCLTCDVCCRFPEADSFLRPYFTEQEIIEAVARGIDPAHFPDRRGGQVSLVPNPTGEGFLCPAFDPATSHCRIYEGRPLDCQLYPLTVMWMPPAAAGEGQGVIGNRPESPPLPIAHSPLPAASVEKPQVVLGWDAKCPFMRDSPSEAILAHAERIISLLEQDAIIAIFAAHPKLVGRFQDDVIVLRRLPALTARLRGGGEGSEKGGTSETGNTSRALVAPFPPVSPVSPAAGILPRPLTFADRSRLEAACALVETPLAAYAFAPHMIWRRLFAYVWAEVDGHFCLFAEYADGVYMPLPPLPYGVRSEVGGVRREAGSLDSDLPNLRPLTSNLYPEIVERCFRFMVERNKHSAVSRIENIPEEWKPEFETLGCRLTPKDPDYLYRTAELVALAGDPYKSQRAACNRVLREHRCEIGVYRPEHREACLELFRRWRQQQEARPIDGVARHMLGDAESAHREALTNPEAFGLIGRVVRVDGEIRAYTFGYARSRSIFCVLLEVADRTVTGLAPFIFRECCREAAANGFTFINTMDDSGLPHLAAAKRAYHPLRLVPSSIATLP